MANARNANLRRTWRHVAHSAPAMSAAVVLGVLFTVALLDSVHFRPRLAAAPDAPKDASVAYATRTVSGLDTLLRFVIDAREKTYSVPLAWWSFQKETRLEGGREVRELPRLAFGGAHLKDPAREWRSDLLARSLGGLGAGLAVAIVLALGIAALRARARQVTFAGVAGRDPARRDRDAVARDAGDRHRAAAVHRLAGGDLAVLPPVRHRSHRQRCPVPGAQEHPHGGRDRHAVHGRDAAPGDRARPARRLLQGLGRRPDPVPVHGAVVDSADPAGGGLRAADQRVHRSARRHLRDWRRARRVPAVPAVPDPRRHRLGDAVPAAARRDAEDRRARLRAGGARLRRQSLAHHASGTSCPTSPTSC